MLLPFDDVIFEHTIQRDGLTIAAPSQVVVDLLTSPGRGPSEAEAMLRQLERAVREWSAVRCRQNRALGCTQGLRRVSGPRYDEMPT